VQAERRDNLMAPITDLHRAHGSFDARAKARAIAYPGAATRAGIIASGAAVFFALGVLAAPRKKRRPMSR
jgi:hypothetical protein